MLAMFWDDSHHALQRSAQAWVDQHIRPHATAWEEAATFPHELYAQAGAAGLRRRRARRPRAGPT